MDEAFTALDDDGLTDGLAGTLVGIGEGVDDAWAEIDAHPGLDDDQRAELTRHFEAIEEAVTESRKILGVSSENDT
jgi:hypothetical protein